MVLIKFFSLEDKEEGISLSWESMVEFQEAMVA